MANSKKGDPIEACWRRLDDKLKIINFNVKIIDVNSGEQASLHDLEIIQREMLEIQEALDIASRRTYEKKNQDIVFSESKKHLDFISL